MKKLIIVILAVFALTACQEQQKIAFVDNSKLVNEYQEKKDLEAKIKGQQEQLSAKADSLNVVYQQEIQQARIDATKLSQAAMEKLGMEIDKKWQGIRQQLQIEDQEINMQGQKEIDSLISKVKTFVKDYGKKNGYTYILGSNEAGSVMYGKDENDLTATLLEQLNAAYTKDEN